jgi:hypothetical protein
MLIINRLRPLWPIILGLIVFVLYFISHIDHPDWYKHFVYQAFAFLHGQLDLRNLPGIYLDLVKYHGKDYLPNPPLPAILLMPFVAVWGIATQEVRVSMFFGAVDVVLVWILLGRMKHLKLTGHTRLMLTLLYGFGTVHYSATILGTIWFYAHVIAELGMLLALVEFFGRSRFPLIGFFMGLAFLSRQATLLGSIFFLGWLVLNRPPRWFRAIVSYGAGFFPSFIFQSWFNWARFGNPLESGYLLQNYYSSVQSPDIEKYGFFNIAYLSKHLHLIFAQMPDRLPDFPYLRPNPQGMNVWLTTPAIFAFLAADWRETLNWLAFLASLLIMVPAVFYTATGWVQFGYRYTLDFLPFFFIPLASGFTRLPRPMANFLVLVSICVNIWGVYWAVKLGW